MDNTFIANLLIELLSDYNRVSLPCLGSFMGQYKPAYFSADGKVVHPPSKQIEFHQNEIWNDERLEKLIAERKGYSLGEAKEKLAFWIDNACASLSMSETVILPNFGEFVVSYGNRLKFIQYNNKNLLLESFGFAPIDLEINTTPPTPPTLVNSTITPTQLPKKHYTWVWVTLLVVILLILTTGALIHFRVITLPDSVIEKHPWINNYLKTQTVNEDALFPINNDDDYEEYNTSQSTDNWQASANINSADTLQNVPLTVDSLNINGTDTIKQDIVPPKPIDYYHIVVSTANNYNDARNHAKDWAKKGYVAQILYSVDDKEPYKISIEFYVNEEDAIKKLEQYKQDDEEFKNAYIFIHNNESKL